jgi:hypothetical protein
LNRKQERKEEASKKEKSRGKKQKPRLSRIRASMNGLAKPWRSKKKIERLRKTLKEFWKGIREGEETLKSDVAHAL